MVRAIDEALVAIEQKSAVEVATAKTLVAPWTPKALEARSATLAPIGAKRLPGWSLAVTALGSLVVGSAVVLILRGLTVGGTSPRPLAARPAQLADAVAPLPVSVAPPLPSAAAPATSPAPPRTLPSTIDGIDAAGYRAHIERAVSIKEWALGARAVVALARLEPTFLENDGVRAQVVVVAAGIGHESKTELADAVFNALTSSLGPSGLDVLYELALSRGGTRAGQRARGILSRPGVREHATPALRVAFEFFVAGCAARRALLEKAVEQGDRRVLVQLEAARGTKCTARGESCCLYDDARVANAIATLHAKLDH